jgi:hypothetical protein
MSMESPVNSIIVNQLGERFGGWIASPSARNDRPGNVIARSAATKQSIPEAEKAEHRSSRIVWNTVSPAVAASAVQRRGWIASPSARNDGRVRQGRRGDRFDCAQGIAPRAVHPITQIGELVLLTLSYCKARRLTKEGLADSRTIRGYTADAAERNGARSAQ